MKSLLNLMLLFSFIGLSAQSVSDYAFVYVPKKFKDFKTNNEYNLNKILSQKLKDKNYSVLNEDPEKWDIALKQNSCSVLNAEVLNDSNMFKNRLKLTFTDCSGKTILSIPATGDFKEYDKGYQDALLKAVAKVPSSTSTQRNLPVMHEENLSLNQPVTTIRDQQEPASTNLQPVNNSLSQNTSPSENKAEVYTGNNKIYNKVNLSAGQFIFTSTNSSVPFAAFKQSTKPGVYRVQLENGSQTLGYDEGNSLVIEIPLADGGYKKEIFLRK